METVSHCHEAMSCCFNEDRCHLKKLVGAALSEVCRYMATIGAPCGAPKGGCQIIKMEI